MARCCIRVCITVRVRLGGAHDGGRSEEEDPGQQKAMSRVVTIGVRARARVRARFRLGLHWVTGGGHVGFDHDFVEHIPLIPYVGVQLLHHLPAPVGSGPGHPWPQAGGRLVSVPSLCSCLSSSLLVETSFVKISFSTPARIQL